MVPESAATVRVHQGAVPGILDLCPRGPSYGVITIDVLTVAMGKDVDLSDDRSTDRRTITDEYFEREVYLSREQTAAFLRDLADSIEEDTTVTVSGDGWTIPFEYREPIEVEVEFTSRYEKELEIELEFEAPKGGGEFAVE